MRLTTLYPNAGLSLRGTIRGNSFIGGILAVSATLAYIHVSGVIPLPSIM